MAPTWAGPGLFLFTIAVISRDLSIETTCIQSFMQFNPLLLSDRYLDQSEENVDCECGFSHNILPRLGSPIFVTSLFHVLERNPLRIGPSSEVVSCPFQFVLETELRYENCFPFEKIFRVVLRCHHAFNKQLPSCQFQYMFWFRNGDDEEKNLTKEGIWFYPKSKIVVWDALRYSELVNPKKNWIVLQNGNECLEIVVRLVRC